MDQADRTDRDRCNGRQLSAALRSSIEDVTLPTLPLLNRRIIDNATGSPIAHQVAGRSGTTVAAVLSLKPGHRPKRSDKPTNAARQMIVMAPKTSEIRSRSLCLSTNHPWAAIETTPHHLWEAGDAGANGRPGVEREPAALGPASRMHSERATQGGASDNAGHT